MADWPTVEEVKLSLGVTTAAKDSIISSAVGAAIEQVAVDVGYLEISVSQESSPLGEFTLTATLDPDESPGPAEIAPSYSLSQAALYLAVMAVKAPDAPYGIAAVFDIGSVRGVAQHPAYLRMLTGQRHAFGLV